MTSFFPLDKRIKQSRILNDKALNFKKQYFKVVKGIRNYVKKNNIDVFIDVEVISSIFSIPATRFTKTKHIAWEHFNFYENNGSSLRALARKIDGRFSDYIITLTEEDKNNYLNNLKIKGKIDYIYNQRKILCYYLQQDILQNNHHLSLFQPLLECGWIYQQ